MKANVLFLLGLMRSGTTYFRNVLSANSNVQVLGSELNAFWTRVGRAPCGTVPSCPQRTAEDAKAPIVAEVRRGFAKRYAARNFPHNIAYRTYRRIRYGNETFLKYGSPFYLLNKSTHLNNKVLFLHEIFPKAKFIFLIRDVFSHANSLHRHLCYMQDQGYNISYPAHNQCWQFVGKQCASDDTKGHRPFTFSFKDVPRYWLEQNILALKSLQTLQRDQFYCIRYEDIVNNLSAVLNRLSVFLHIDLNRDVDTKLINNYTSKPLESWKDDLSKDQVTAIKQLLAQNQDDLALIHSFFPSD